MNNLLRQEPRAHNHEVFIVSCGHCKTFESLQVHIYGNTYKVEESSHYYRRGDDIIHKCGAICVFTGKRFLAGVSREML